MQLKFSKMHSQGQDFILTEFVRTAGFIRPYTAVKLLHRTLGIGADEIVLLEHPQRPDDDFYCRVLDAQGHEVPISYGAARCATRYVQEQYLTGKDHLKLGFLGGSLPVHALPNKQVCLEFSPPTLEPQQMQLPLERFKAEYDLLIPELGPLPMGIVQLQETGAQVHATVRVDDLQDISVSFWGQAIADSEHFPIALGVNFAQAIDAQKMRLQSYSAQPQAADVQVACAVISAQLRGWQENPVQVLLNDHIYWVEWSESHSVAVTAPVTTVFDGRIFI